MEWEEIKKIGKVSTGNTPPKKNPGNYNEDYIALVKPSNFIENKIVDIKKGEEYLSKKGKSKGRIADIDDVLITCIGNIGNIGIVSKEVCFNQQINSIKADITKIVPKYLTYAITYIKPTLNHIANKAVVPIINKTTFEKTKIPILPMKIQKQIVEILDEAQSLIDTRKKQIKLLDDLIQSIFYEMFGDPVKNDKGWKVKKLNYFGTWSSGGTPSRKNKEFFKGNINWFSAGELNNRYAYKSNEKITKEALEKSSAKLFKKGSILVGMYDTAAFKLSILSGEASSNQACANLECNENYNVEWVYELFKIMRPIYLQRRIGVRQKNLSQTTIKGFNAISPPIQLQNQFAEKVKLIETKKQLMKNSLNLLEDNYKSLMQRAFKGELF